MRHAPRKRRADARSLTRSHSSLPGGFDRDVTPAVAGPEGGLPLLFLAMLASNWRVRVGVGGATERRIADAIAATSRRHVLALGQSVEAAREHVGYHVPSAVLVVLRCSRRCDAENGSAGDRCGTQRQKLFHVCSPCFLICNRMSSHPMRSESCGCSRFRKSACRLKHFHANRPNRSSVRRESLHSTLAQLRCTRIDGSRAQPARAYDKELMSGTGR